MQTKYMLERKDPIIWCESSFNLQCAIPIYFLSAIVPHKCVLTKLYKVFAKLFSETTKKKVRENTGHLR